MIYCIIIKKNTIFHINCILTSCIVMVPVAPHSFNWSSGHVNSSSNAEDNKYTSFKGLGERTETGRNIFAPIMKIKILKWTSFGEKERRRERRNWERSSSDKINLSQLHYKGRGRGGREEREEERDKAERKESKNNKNNDQL